MFSLKRSAAALGVVVGLLLEAAPASAQLPPTIKVQVSLRTGPGDEEVEQVTPASTPPATFGGGLSREN